MSEPNSAIAAMEAILVSPEMTALFGAGAIGATPMPDDPIALTIGFARQDGAPTLHLDPTPPTSSDTPNGDGAYRMIFFIARAAVTRLGGEPLAKSLHRDFHLPPELRAIAIALRDASTPAQSRGVYLGAKSTEFFCEAIRLFGQGALVPFAQLGALSCADRARVIAARRLIETQWSEKLTLESIGRACGLNRAKLTRGFRELFDQTVAEAIAEERLARASRLLLTTDRPVSSIGYEAGYLNNASFARAFGRRFGRTPSNYRAGGAAA